MWDSHRLSKRPRITGPQPAAPRRRQEDRK
jgi:hypothetical protein